MELAEHIAKKKTTNPCLFVLRTTPFSLCLLELTVRSGRSVGPRYIKQPMSFVRPRVAYFRRVKAAFSPQIGAVVGVWSKGPIWARNDWHVYHLSRFELRASFYRGP